MRAKIIDHVNLRILRVGVDASVQFYRDLLGFNTQNLVGYKTGENTLFSFRPEQGSRINIQPVAYFESPGVNFDHLAVVVDVPTKALRSALTDAGVPINRDRNRTQLIGADSAIYLGDPFGYTLELRPRS